jgi:hypothetical protein
LLMFITVIYTLLLETLIVIIDVYNSYLYSVVGDSLAWHSGVNFSTRNQDNDLSIWRNCAVAYHGAWWYNDCHHSNLNGLYGGPRVSGGTYNRWYHWKKDSQSLKATAMLIKPQL